MHQPFEMGEWSWKNLCCVCELSSALKRVRERAGVGECVRDGVCQTGSWWKCKKIVKNGNQREIQKKLHIQMDAKREKTNWAKKKKNRNALESFRLDFPLRAGMGCVVTKTKWKIGIIQFGLGRKIFPCSALLTAIFCKTLFFFSFRIFFSHDFSAIFTHTKKCGLFKSNSLLNVHRFYSVGFFLSFCFF